MRLLLLAFAAVASAQNLAPTSTVPRTTTATRPATTATPATWTTCAQEHDTCTCAGTVRYGKNGVYLYYPSFASVPCGNEVAGDPLVGTLKQCDCMSDPSFAPPGTTFQTQNFTITAQAYGPIRVSGNIARLVSGSPINLVTYSGPDVYNIDTGRFGLFQNGNRSLALRKLNSAIVTQPFQPQSADFAWRIWAYGSKYRLYNDANGGKFVGYDAAADALVIVDSTDSRVVGWDIAPTPLSGYVWTPPIQTNIQVQVAGAAINSNSVSLSINGYGSLSVNVSYSNQSVKATGCPQGNYCPGGVLTPIQCPVGTYNPLFGQANLTSCLPCPRGAWCGLGSTNATSCGAGTYSTLLGASTVATCAKCAAGKYSSSLGASATATCANCAAGSYSTGQGAVSIATCQYCMPGYYAPVGSTGCQSCAAGTYSTATAANSAAACSLCSPGTFSPTVAASASSTCIRCDPGTFSTASGANSENICTDCGSGTYSTATGFTGTCATCAANSYCPNPVSQLPCPANTVSQPGQINQMGCTCVAGYFCTYDKVARLSISLSNIPLSDWNDNVNGIQDAFIAAVAQAAGVPPSSITIVGVTMPQGSRRLLGAAEGLDALLINVAIEGGHTDAVKTEWSAPDLLREMRVGAEAAMAVE